MRGRRISVGLVLTLLITGCGGSAGITNPSESTTTPTAAPSPVVDDTVASGISSGVDDVCALLGTEDLAGAAGGTWGEPRNVPGAQSVECDYVEDSTGTKFFVAIHNEEAVAAAGGPEAMVSSLAYPAGSTGTEIDSGDGAFFFTFPNVRNFTVMLVGDAVIVMSGETTFGIAFDQESMTEIAHIVADNL